MPHLWGSATQEANCFLPNAGGKRAENATESYS
jgi:hypothetical protein